MVRTTKEKIERIPLLRNPHGPLELHERAEIGTKKEGTSLYYVSYACGGSEGGRVVVSRRLEDEKRDGKNYLLEPHIELKKSDIIHYRSLR